MMKKTEERKIMEKMMMEEIKEKNVVKKIFSLFSKILSPLLGLLICLLLIFIFSKNPGEAVKSFFAETFSSKYYFGLFLTQGGYLLLASCGAFMAYKSGNMNLGGEGQIYLGGFTACLVLLYVKGEPLLVMTLSIFTCIFSGSLMAGFSAVLKERKKVPPLLTSFLLSSAVIPLIDGIILSIKSGSQTNTLSLDYIDPIFRMKKILSPSPLTISFFLSLAIFLACAFIFTKTKFGREIKIWGVSEDFAKYAGLSSKKNTYLTLLFSGALHSLTGFFAVTGSYFTCHQNFYSGMGWNALSAALLASENPFLLLPASLFLAWLYTSADRVSLTQGFTFDIASIIQAIILFTSAIPWMTKKITSLKRGLNE